MKKFIYILPFLILLNGCKLFPGFTWGFPSQSVDSTPTSEESLSPTINPSSPNQNSSTPIEQSSTPSETSSTPSISVPDSSTSAPIEDSTDDVTLPDVPLN